MPVHWSRTPVALRGVAVVVALSVTAAASGLPMCVSLVARVAAPCDGHRAGGGGARPEQVVHRAAVAPQASPHACHPDAAGLGCAAGSVCPTAGPAVPLWASVPVALRATSRVSVPGPVSPLVSYFAPPLSPPPQA